jgi:hypothetical protein
MNINFKRKNIMRENKTPKFGKVEENNYYDTFLFVLLIIERMC